MTARTFLKNTSRGLAAGAAIAAIGYASMVAYHRAKYGRVSTTAGGVDDSLLDRFIPRPEVAEHHQISIDAPADVVLATAKQIDVLQSPLIRAIFRLRELALGGQPDERPHPSALAEQMLSIGWVVLAERAGREVVFGCVTQPWEAAPVFRPIPAEDFKNFAEPGYVKIVWTLRADPIGNDKTTFHTETRVCTTDAAARKRFRAYWSFVAPGVELIRLAMLRPLKRAAERRAATAA